MSAASSVLNLFQPELQPVGLVFYLYLTIPWL